MATDELAAKLRRRNQLNEAAEAAEAAAAAQQATEERPAPRVDGGSSPASPTDSQPSPLMPSLFVWNPYNEFKELTRKEIQHYQKIFKL